MRFPRMSRGSSGSRSSSGVVAAPGASITTLPCTYHGWVMLPPSMLRSSGSAASPDGSADLPVSYNRLVEMAKRVGVAQTTKSRSRKPERATTVITNDSVRIISKKHEEGAMPLLHASINTIICTLISKRTGVAVIVAHTWDGQGQRGIGCDVIRLKPRGCNTFKATIQASIDALNARTAASRARRESEVAPPPYTPFDPNTPPSGPPPAARGSVEEPPRQRARGDGGDGGYMAIEPFVAFDEPADLEFGDDVDGDGSFDGDDAAAYMDICGPAGDSGYMTISPPQPLYAEIDPDTIQA